MTNELMVLIITAASLGFFHTLFGPDHYLPFIVMGRAGKWSFFKVVTITFLCGVGHVLGSVLLGFIGIILGWAVSGLESFEGSRGDIAAWALISIGFLYFAWGMKKAFKNKPHSHTHIHDGISHSHEHIHGHEHAHIHEEEVKQPNFTPWILFIIFVLGPCEPLIPLLMYPAAKESTFGIIMVASVFSLTTIFTMLTITIIGFTGLKVLPLDKIERYTHALAGATICVCGLCIQFLGL